jgi:hypothetical protein
MIQSDYHPKTKSENCPSILFDGVPGVPTAAAAASGSPGEFATGLGACPGFRNADVEGASWIGVPTVGVLLWGVRAIWDEREGATESPDTISDDGLKSGGASGYAMRGTDWPIIRSAWLGSWKRETQPRFASAKDKMASYRPLDTNHPASTDDLSIFTNCPHRIDRIFETNPEAIGNLRIWIWVCCLAKLLEVFNSDAVFIWRVAKNDNVERFNCRVRHILGCSRNRHGRIKV